MYPQYHHHFHRRDPPANTFQRVVAVKHRLPFAYCVYIEQVNIMPYNVYMYSAINRHFTLFEQEH